VAVAALALTARCRLPVERDARVRDEASGIDLLLIRPGEFVMGTPEGRPAGSLRRFRTGCA
jgi:hypothetical protein